MTDFQSLVIAVQQGDRDALLPMTDLLQEQGKPMVLDVGKKYLVMTLTNYYTGEVTESTPSRKVLKDPAWIPDTGRLSVALATGELQEVEPGPDGESLILNTGHITNGWEWHHSLPRKAK